MPIVPRVNLLPKKYRPRKVFIKFGGHKKVWPPVARFWLKVNKLGLIWNSTHCWEWTGCLDGSGYPLFTVDNMCPRTQRAYKWYWEYLNGRVPEGLELDHLCRNRRCVNPNHLEPVTHRVNMHRGNGFAGINIRKTHCKQGHEFTPENTYACKRGERRCRMCGT